MARAGSHYYFHGNYIKLRRTALLYMRDEHRYTLSQTSRATQRARGLHGEHGRPTMQTTVYNATGSSESEVKYVS